MAGTGCKKVGRGREESCRVRLGGARAIKEKLKITRTNSKGGVVAKKYQRRNWGGITWKNETEFWGTKRGKMGETSDDNGEEKKICHRNCVLEGGGRKDGRIDSQENTLRVIILSALA